MCLPTLPTYLELKKVNFNQEHLKLKHYTAQDNSDKWANTTKYFNSTETRTKKQNEWSTEKSFNKSMNAYTRQAEQTQEKKEQKLMALKMRQFNLKNLIDAESKSFEQELKTVRINGKDNSNTVFALKERAQNLKSAREDDRKRLAEAKLYENWRSNNPELRALESRKLQDHVTEQWSDQLAEKRQAASAQQQQQNEYLKYLDLEEQKAAGLDVELKRLKLNREIQLKEILKEQMIELKQREAESAFLVHEETHLIKENLEMAKINEEREKRLNSQSRQEYGRTLLRQHKAKLRLKAQQVQESLELDLALLNLIAQSQLEKRDSDTAAKIRAQADAHKMMQILEDQLRLEKVRQAELDQMFQDEAAKQWAKRTEEWEREEDARQLLMKQVLDERQRQLLEKFEVIADKKREALMRRQELIQDMEQTQAMAKQEREKAQRAKIDVQVDLQQQITTRKDHLFQNEVLADVQSYEEEQIKNQNYNNFLNMESKKVIDAKFEPKTFGRKKVAWS